MKKIVTFLLIPIFLLAFATQVKAKEKELCDDNSPSTKPVLTSAVANRDGTVTLTWTKAGDPITHYLLAYSRNETEIEFGNPNIGGKDATTYTVGNLEKGQKYYFKVRPVNGCRPGDFSNKLSAVPGQPSAPAGRVVSPKNVSMYKQVLGTTVSPSPFPEETSVPRGTAEPVSTVNELRCTGCLSLPILIFEAVALFVYFLFANSRKVAKPIFSIFIPAALYLVFASINQGCVSNAFLCKYFVPLEVIIFLTIVIMFKNKFVKKI